MIWNIAISESAGQENCQIISFHFYLPSHLGQFVSFDGANFIVSNGQILSNSWWGCKLNCDFSPCRFKTVNAFFAVDNNEYQTVNNIWIWCYPSITWLHPCPPASSPQSSVSRCVQPLMITAGDNKLARCSIKLCSRSFGHNWACANIFKLNLIPPLLVFQSVAWEPGCSAPAYQRCRHEREVASFDLFAVLWGIYGIAFTVWVL